MADAIKVVYLYADSDAEWNCSAWRCHMLSNGINYQHERNPLGFPHEAKMYALKSALDFHHPEVQTKLGWADVILYQRNVLFDGVWNSMDYWRVLGKIILVDLDDGYSAIPP